MAPPTRSRGAATAPGQRAPVVMLWSTVGGAWSRECEEGGGVVRGEGVSVRLGSEGCGCEYECVKRRWGCWCECVRR